MPNTDRRPALFGRRSECERLSSLVAAAKAGRSQVLVLRGEAGIGKTALLEFMLDRAAGCAVTRAAGVESEMQLPFAGLYQVCTPYLSRLDRLPAPQHKALGTAFGLHSGSAPDRFLIGLAVLTLLSQAAEERPLICLVDDAQWLDQESTQVLQFIARRLAADPVTLVFAVRSSDRHSRLTGLPELEVKRLDRAAAAALLEATVTSTLDPRIRERILAESNGNPLAILELPRGLSTAQLAFGGDVRTVATPLAHRLEQEFLRQVQPLAPPCRQLLLTAAAEPLGDVPLLWRAAGRLGIPSDAVAAAEDTGLIELGGRVRFRHPLVRSAIYHSAGEVQRRAVHQALAEATDPELDPDRRAWHRACAAVGPDEAVAGELEASAGRALAHGGLSAAAAFLERSAALTPDPARRGQRSLDAAQAKITTGAFGDATALVSIAELCPLGEAEVARIELLKAQMSFAANRGSEALPLLLAAARRLEPLDADLARDTYLDALSASLFAGRLAEGPGARQVAEAARQAPAPRTPRKGDLLLQGLATLFTDGYSAAVPASVEAIEAFLTGELAMDEALRFAWLAASTAVSLWDDAGWDRLSQRHLDVARSTGALSALPLALTSRVFVHLFTGDLTAAESLLQEIRSVAEVTGGEVSLAPYAEVSLAAVRGREEADRSIHDCLRDFTARGEGVGVNMMQWSRAVLCNATGRYGQALVAAQAATVDPLELGPPKWALGEAVEAGVRIGDTAAASAALEQLSTMAAASGTDWALGVEAGRRALLQGGVTAEELYREAISRLACTRVRVDLARAQLLYGEWLRREGRRVDARAQLRTAHEALTAMGVEGFAQRARRELLATGESVRKRRVEISSELTPQEAHIARLAAQGLTNPEIGAELYLSPRTVEWHLRKIFAKVGATTRRELRRALPVTEHEPTTV
ncbi:helix-turn-helix transcriptional regulator [Geodermatophilus sp. SYSU D00766]